MTEREIQDIMAKLEQLFIEVGKVRRHLDDIDMMVRQIRDRLALNGS